MACLPNYILIDSRLTVIETLFILLNIAMWYFFAKPIFFPRVHSMRPTHILISIDQDIVWHGVSAKLYPDELMAVVGTLFMLLNVAMWYFCETYSFFLRDRCNFINELQFWYSKCKNPSIRRLFKHFNSCLRGTTSVAA